MSPEATGGLPARVGRYEVIAHLATGGMAQIYLARQTGLGSFERHVVLKTILRERATDQRFVTMFLDEAKLAATLNHQNVAQVYEVDQADGAYFMAMEYVHGENARAILETSLRRGWTVPLELAVMIISGAAAGLHHAHERRGKNGQPLNIVHRDVSPANIMVGYDGSVKVLDFGIAKAEERATKTVGGTIKGKYGYMSPEQCKGKTIDRRSDIFALGIVLYELTTLRRAFKGNDDFETMKRIVSGDIVLPSVAVSNFPRELEAIILTAMASDANARFQTAAEMIEALDTFTQRAKLTGTGTAMGRFMTQLFGVKREPWVEGEANAPANEHDRARTEGGPGAAGPNDSTQVTDQAIDESDNEKTQLVEGRNEFAAADLDAWAGHDSTSQKRREAHQPSPPAPPPGNPQTQPMGAPIPPSGQYSVRPTVNHLAPPPTGSNAALVPPRPTAPPLAQPSAGRPPMPIQIPVPNPTDYRIRSSRGWVVLAVSVVIAIGVAIAIGLSM